MTEAYRELGSQVLTVTGIFFRDFFTLAIESYEVFPTTALGFILQSVNQVVQYMSDAGHRYARLLSLHL